MIPLSFTDADAIGGEALKVRHDELDRDLKGDEKPDKTQMTIYHMKEEKRPNSGKDSIPFEKSRFVVLPPFR